MSADFEVLARDRHLLQEFCKYHVPSLSRFGSSDPNNPSFRLRIKEELGNELRHLTSTATCIESFLDCPPRQRPSDAQELAGSFATKAIDREDWKSEKSAAIYCRCRALPLVTRYISKYDKRLDNHIKKILKQLEMTSDRLGLGEADPEKEPDE